MRHAAVWIALVAMPLLVIVTGCVYLVGVSAALLIEERAW